MADKLDWLNEHFVLQNNLTVSEVIEKQNYKLPFELRETALKYPMSEDFVKALVSQGKFKQASEFLAYNLHRRALAWWGYCVVLSLTKELHDSPAKERDISEIGKPKKLEVPDWAKEIPSDEKSFAEKFEEELAKLEKTKETALKKAEESLEKAGPEAKAIFYEAKKMVWDLFKKEVGMDPDEFMNKTIADAQDLIFTFYRFSDDLLPEATVKFEGRYSPLRMYLNDKAVYSNEEKASYMPVEISGRNGESGVLYLKISFNKDLIEPDKWPSSENWPLITQF